MNKHVLLIGAAGVAGVIALVLLMREKSSSPVSSLPREAESPSSFPSYPAPPPLPAFNVTATPYYLTYNIAPDKKAGLESKTDSSKGDCGCKDGGCKDNGNVVSLSQSFLKTASANVKRAFQAGPNTGNLMAQFPPEIYPYLYQKGGTA